MSTSNDSAELLRRGIEAARDGKRSEARELFESVVEQDEKNEKGWFWLASVVESDEERRICLSNVLHINPNNERAKRALDALQVKAKETKDASAQVEVVAGVTRRQMSVVVGLGAFTVIIILIIALVVVVGNNNRQNADRATAQAIAQAAVDTAATATAFQNATLVAVAQLATDSAATAQASITPVLPTRSLPTLPPTWTPTPQATLPPTRQILPPPTGLKGRLAVWGGQDVISVGYLPLGYFDFDLGSQYTQIGTSLGANISFDATGQRVVYTVYDQLIYGLSIEAINLNGSQAESLPTRWMGQNIFNPEQPHYGGPNRQYVVFIAHSDKQQTPQVFMVDLKAAQGANPVTQLTHDDTNYSAPVMSPDGTRVIAVRNDPNSATPTYDLVSIDVAAGTITPVTSDGPSFIESSPVFSADGSKVIFAAAPSNEPNNNDIYIRNADGTGSTLPLYRGPDNDVHPVLSPDGNYLAFASNGGGRYDIYIYDQNAAKLSQLTDTPDDEFPGDWWQP